MKITKNDKKKFIKLKFPIYIYVVLNTNITQTIERRIQKERDIYIERDK